jgi:hypothetical protein
MTALQITVPLFVVSNERRSIRVEHIEPVVKENQTLVSKNNILLIKND